MTTAALSRLIPKTQLSPVDTLVTLGTVPANTQWSVKSLYMRNTRSDNKSVTWNLYVVLSGESLTATWNSPWFNQLWLYNRIVTPGELQVYEYNLLLLNAGDSIVAIGHEATGVWAEVHGLAIA